MKIKVKESSFHRNGIGGEGFYAVLFNVEQEPGTEDVSPHDFLGIVFDEPGHCAVVALNLISECGVRFAAGNSWRGDHFEVPLRDHIKEGVTTGIRFGPFAL